MPVVIDCGAVIGGFRELTKNDHIRTALKKACDVVQAEARSDSTHRFVTKTGQLENAISTDVSAEKLTGEVFIDSSVAPYGIYVHEPTGTYAKAANRKLNKSKYYRWPDGSYAIRPVDKKALRYVNSDGEWEFRRSVRHPGTPEDPFLYTALDKKEEYIVNLFREIVQNGARRAGFGD